MKVQSNCRNCSESSGNTGQKEERSVFCGELLNKTRFDEQELSTHQPIY
jgi:hypothetical protein